jgi:hypothetical protein
MNIEAKRYVAHTVIIVGQNLTFYRIYTITNLFYHFLRLFNKLLTFPMNIARDSLKAPIS